MKTVECSITRYTLRDDGIVAAIGTHPEIPRDLTTMTASLDCLAGLIDGTPRPILWDPRAVLRLFPEAWKAIIERIESLAVAVAILADDGTEEMLGPYPGAMNSLLLPVRTFTDEEQAIEWLRKFVDDEAAA